MVPLDVSIPHRLWNFGRRDNAVVCQHLVQPRSSRTNAAILVLMRHRPHKRNNCPWFPLARRRCHHIRPPASNYRESEDAAS